MGKASSRKKKQRGALQEPSTNQINPQEENAKWPHSYLLRISSLFVAVIGLISAIASMDTKLTVTVGDAFKEGDFESIPFEMVNDSPYPVDWLGNACIIHAISFKDGSKIEGFNSFPAISQRERISKGRGRTTFCALRPLVDKPMEAMDISLLIFYKPWFSPIEQSEKFRFQIGPDQAGKLRSVRLQSTDQVKFEIR